MLFIQELAPKKKSFSNLLFVTVQFIACHTKSTLIKVKPVKLDENPQSSKNLQEKVILQKVFFCQDILGLPFVFIFKVFYEANGCNSLSCS